MVNISQGRCTISTRGAYEGVGDTFPLRPPRHRANQVGPRERETATPAAGAAGRPRALDICSVQYGFLILDPKVLSEACLHLENGGSGAVSAEKASRYSELGAPTGFRRS